MNKNLYIVEGKTDVSKLKSLKARFVLETEGFLVSNELVGFLELAEKQRKLVLVLDPDGPGRTIREKLHKFVTNYEDVEVDKRKASGKAKIGVAETNVNYLANLMSPFLKQDEESREEETISFSELIDLGLMGADASSKKNILKNKYHLTITSSKALVDQLCILRLTAEEIKKDIL
jgi:ribonuclease M5